MINVPKYNKENRRQSFEILPKGAYVCKIMDLEEVTYKNGKRGIKISFDIAEGEYKDFYAEQYRKSTSEDKHWSYDAVYYISIPFDGCEAYIQTNWDTFWADIEDSNNGFVFDGDEKKVKGKVFGGVFRIEQTEYNGNVYDHTRLAGTRVAQDVRDGKVTKLPKDKLIENASSSVSAEDFISIEADEEDLPFGNKK